MEVDAEDRGLRAQEHKPIESFYHSVACKIPSEREGIRKGRWVGKV
ncbi:MAG: hypothetical protein XD54_1681 [Thermococcus sibiricus]|uniref:Uncharacterized protein n=1 Tax=Thermococcus sibiricus TaxID=172049 RepID=A0A101EKG2_9EURY|nr:MAG: hypothetical protein XD54_1681 [Thermococcus sibiricus]